MALPAHEETFQGTGGLKIFFRSWRPAGSPRGVIVICHGVNSHGGQYLWPAQQFAASGLAASKDKTLKLYEGHYHDLLNDVGKDGVLSDIKSWIYKHLAA